MTPDRTLSDWLQLQPGGIREILSRSRHLVQVNRALHDWLREPWADAVRLTSFEGDTAVFYVANASASTMLHFQSPAVLTFLRERFDARCTRVQIRVRPEAYKP